MTTYRKLSFEEKMWSTSALKITMIIPLQPKHSRSATNKFIAGPVNTK